METFAKLSASVPDVVAKTQTMRLIEGATDFGSPLALCHNNIKNMATGTTADTKKFCVVISYDLSKHMSERMSKHMSEHMSKTHV